MQDEPTKEDLKRAAEWRDAHWKRVESLLDDAWNCYAPTGSDCAHPDLWKPAHWAWFEAQTQNAE